MSEPTALPVDDLVRRLRARAAGSRNNIYVLTIDALEVQAQRIMALEEIIRGHHAWRAETNKTDAVQQATITALRERLERKVRERHAFNFRRGYDAEPGLAGVQPARALCHGCDWGTRDIYPWSAKEETLSLRHSAHVSAMVAEALRDLP